MVQMWVGNKAKRSGGGELARRAVWRFLCAEFQETGKPVAEVCDGEVTSIQKSTAWGAIWRGDTGAEGGWKQGRPREDPRRAVKRPTYLHTSRKSR